MVEGKSEMVFIEFMALTLRVSAVLVRSGLFLIMMCPRLCKYLLLWLLQLICSHADSWMGLSLVDPLLQTAILAIREL